MLTIYQYPKCSTCRKALAWLEARGIAYEKVDITTSPPSATVLKGAMDAAALPIGKLFNTSGESYRNGNWKEKLASATEAQALAALAADGKLIKRPLVVGDGVALVGFKEDEWASRLTKK